MKQLTDKALAQPLQQFNTGPLSMLSIWGLSSLGIKVILFLTLALQFIPFSPKMPALGLDASWALSLNQAVAQGLVFGKDIVFTLGPYAAIYTKAYHPATDTMMLWGSLYLTISSWVCLLLLSTRKTQGWLIAWSLFLVGLLYARDILLCAYPLMAGLACVKRREQNSKLILTAVLLAPLGLLPLIKGSILLLAISSLGITLCYFIYHKEYKSTLVSLTAPIGCMMLCWKLAGQPLAFLPTYMLTSIQIALDFTEAMAIYGHNQEIIAYLFASISLLCSLINIREKAKRLFTFSLFFLFLFLAFKASFTRHFGHSYIAGTAILQAGLLIPFLMTWRKALPIFLLSLGCGCYIIGQNTTINLNYNIKSTIAAAWNGINNRFFSPHWLQQNYSLSLDFLQKQSQIPLLPGKTDIYSYKQTALIASGNQWSPRPIFQSYSVFSQALAQRNKDYLLSSQGPEFILFYIEPIDERLPALEDGASWSVMVSHYQLIQQTANYLILKRKKRPVHGLERHETILQKHKLGEKVVLSYNDQKVQATLSIRPTFLGQLTTFFYKPSPLFITLQLTNGLERRFRISANMAQSSFLLSPFVENVHEFALLYRDQLDTNRVQSFVINADKANSWEWQPDYDLKIDLPRRVI